MKNTTNEIEALIPISIELDWPTKDEIVNCIREQNKLFGFKKFLLAGPGGGHRSNRYPDTALFEELYRPQNAVLSVIEPLPSETERSLESW